MNTIRVTAQSWGDAQIRDVQAVLDSVAYTFQVHAGISHRNTILVTQSTEQFPRALSEPGPNGERIILLATSDRKWSQLAYQFSHEYCHVFTKHYLTPLNHPFMWFDESICELASLWCLGRMSSDWAANPPYPNWASYRTSLQKYAENQVIGVPKHESPCKFREWLDSNLFEMTANSVNRELNKIVAVQLHPIFQKEPSLWMALELLNQNPQLEGDFQLYLQRWYNTVAADHRVSVRNISAELGYDLQT